jgi:benzoyl-CoA reductase subunit C
MNEVATLKQLIAPFAEVAARPLESARRWKTETGGRVIGLLPMHFPGELAAAAGALPVLIQEAEDPISIGLGSFFSFYCGYTRSLVDQALKGDFAFLDAILFGDHCVQLLGAADAIRMEQPATKILFNQLISSLDMPWAREQARASFRRLRDELAELIGGPITDEALHDTFKVFNRNRARIRRLYDLRRAGKLLLSARQLQDIVKSSMVMDRVVHNMLLDRLLGWLEAHPAPRSNGVRLYLSGHLCQAPKLPLLDLIEECGAVTVDDDLFHGYRYIACDVEPTGDPINALADWYLTRNDRVPCPTRASGKVDWDSFLANAVARSGAQGVIILMAKFCEPHMYYYPEIKERFEREGIPHLLIETEHESMPLEAFKTRIETFVEIVKRRAAA